MFPSIGYWGGQRLERLFFTRPFCFLSANSLTYWSYQQNEIPNWGSRFFEHKFLFITLTIV